MNRPPRVLFAGGGTGGHLYPALALADAFRRRDPATEIFFVGAERGVEARVLPERGVPHRLLPLEPIRRSRPWENWRLVAGSVRSAAGLWQLFQEQHPDLVVGTGGYASGPAVAWGIASGVPTAVQEQNSFPGLVTRWVAGRTRQIHLAFPEARAYLRPGPRTQVFDHGNPIRPPDASIGRQAARAEWELGGGTVMLVVGGSQGAKAINEALLAVLAGVAEGRLPPPPEGLEILWATGPAHIDGVRGELERIGTGGWVHPLGYISNMPQALAAADFAVSRAGAMALAELCAWGLPSILVPLPTAAADHQHHNARALAEAGAAVELPETDLAPERFWAAIRRMAADGEYRAQIATRARERGRPHAADRIVEDLSKLLAR